MKKIFVFIIFTTLTMSIGCSRDLHKIQIGSNYIEYSLPANYNKPIINSNSSYTLYIYKRKPILNKDKDLIIPAIMILVDKNIKAEDPIVYLASKRLQFNFKNVIKTYYHETELIDDKSSLMIFSTNYDSFTKKNMCTYLYCTMISNTGISFILNVTDDVFKKIKPEFISFIKSIKISAPSDRFLIKKNTFVKDGQEITELISSSKISFIINIKDTDKKDDELPGKPIFRKLKFRSLK